MSKKIITGWTNRPPVEHPYEKTCVIVCTPQRRGLCGMKRECVQQRPTCLADECAMVGKKIGMHKFGGVFPEITAEDQKIIHRKLRTAYATCHRVEITVKED